MKSFFAAAAIVALAGTASAQVAFWNFNFGQSSGTTAPTSASTALPSAAAGTWDVGGTFVGTNVQAFTGVTTPVNNDGVDADLGTGAGNDVAFQWGTGGANAGAFHRFVFDASGQSGLQLDFNYRSTSTGPSLLEIYAANDAGSLLAGAPVATVSVVRDGTYRMSSIISLPAAINGDSSAWFAIRPLWNESNHSSSGNLRIDNVRVFIPTPGSVALFGAAGFAALRRRRSA